MTTDDILREYTRTMTHADRKWIDTDAMAAEIVRLREERDEKVKAVAQIVYDAEARAWKPMRVFRSEADVERDEAIHGALSELADKVRKEMEDIP